MGNLEDYAKNELKIAGLLDKDSDYDEMLGKAVVELINTFSEQGHSGYSAQATIDIFCKLASYKPLTEIGKSKDEWIDMSDMAIEPTWQNKRRGTTFSRDNGKTWYDIEDENLNNGDVWVKDEV